jgi:Trypsin-co-occurring domain 1
MPGLLEIRAADSTVLIAISGEPDVVAVANIEERIQEISESLSSKFTVIRQIAEDLIKAIGNSPVTSAELEFGLNATGTGKFYVVETTISATFKVKLTISLGKTLAEMNA